MLIVDSQEVGTELQQLLRSNPPISADDQHFWTKLRLAFSGSKIIKLTFWEENSGTQGSGIMSEGHIWRSRDNIFLVFVPWFVSNMTLDIMC